MMLRFLLVLTLFCVGFAISKGYPPICPPNEHYYNRTLTCETSCADKDVVYIKECERSQPYTGCACNNGYFRNDDGNCVSYDDCSTLKCNGTYEVPNNCAAAQPCRKNCYNRFRPLPIKCPKICVKACTCQEGYLKNDDDVCVPTYECSKPRCNENEEYKQCGSACEADCSNYQKKNRVCTLQCVEGCFCKKGYVRVPNTFTCVKPQDCPAPSS